MRKPQERGEGEMGWKDERGRGMREPEEGEKRDEEAAREERGRWDDKKKEEEG
jgi:hypothetical protein